MAAAPLRKREAGNGKVAPNHRQTPRGVGTVVANKVENLERTFSWNQKGDDGGGDNGDGGGGGDAGDGGDDDGNSDDGGGGDGNQPVLL